MDIGPNRGVAIEVAASLGVFQPGALSFSDDDGFVSGCTPFRLTSKRVPAMGFVSLDAADRFVIHLRQLAGERGRRKQQNGDDFQEMAALGMDFRETTGTRGQMSLISA